MSAISDSTLHEEEGEEEDNDVIHGTLPSTVGPLNGEKNTDHGDQNLHSPTTTTTTTANAPARPRHPDRTRSTLSKTASHRSHNGYGVDEHIPETSSNNNNNNNNNNNDEDEQKDSEKAQTGNKGISPAKDEFEVGFEGGDADPLCPRSFSSGKKWLIVLITSFGSFCVTCASSIYTSTYSQMNTEFGTTNLICTLGLSTFVLGIALGPVWSPLSEFYGRKPIYISSFAVFTIFIVPCAVARNIETVIITRFFQGFAGSAFLSVAGGTVGDLFTPQTMHNPMTVFTLAPFLGPTMGPLIGGFINFNTTWRWTHYVMIIWGSCLFLAIVFLVPETFHAAVLQKEARRKRKETGEERWKAPSEKLDRSLGKTLSNAVTRPFKILLLEPMALCLNLYAAVLLGVLYLFFGAFPLVFETNHGFNLWQTGLTFIGLLAGEIIAAFANPIWVRLRDKAIQKNGGKPEPEYRLYSMMAGCFLVPIGMFWFGWSTFPWVHWIVPIIGSAVFGAGVLFAFNAIFSFLVEAYGQFAASALAANALLRCCFAAAFPLFGIQMYDKLGYQWATSLLAFLTVAMLPFPFIFFKYGKRIRSRSSMAISH